MEKTLIILKPDCMEKKLEGLVLDRFLKSGFNMIACKMMRLDKEILTRHYAHLADKPYFPPILDFMMRSNVLVCIFEGENAIARAREMLGPTDSTKAAKGTIRGDYGTNMRENIAHASDSPESAESEIANFFSKSEIFA